LFAVSGNEICGRCRPLSVMLPSLSLDGTDVGKEGQCRKYRMFFVEERRGLLLLLLLLLLLNLCHLVVVVDVVVVVVVVVGEWFYVRSRKKNEKKMINNDVGSKRLAIIPSTDFEKDLNEVAPRRRLDAMPSSLAPELLTRHCDGLHYFLNDDDEWILQNTS
jgi:hypothetical protein